MVRYIRGKPKPNVEIRAAIAMILRIVTLPPFPVYSGKERSKTLDDPLTVFMFAMGPSEIHDLLRQFLAVMADQIHAI